MPPRGASARGEAKATLAGLLHERICDERFGEAIAELGDDGALGALQARSRARGAARARPRRAACPRRSCARSRMAESAGFEAWQIARAEKPISRSSANRSSASSRCGARRPTLSATRAASATTRCSTSTSPTCASRASSRCSTGCATSSCRSRRRSRRRPRPDDAFVHRRYPALAQRAVGAKPGRRDRLRLRAPAGSTRRPIPFASGFAPGDVRLTTREHEDDLFAGLFAVLHEAGHGLYEQGLTGAIEGTFCGNATSLGLHESQSRFWENMVGRSPAFWERHLAEVAGRVPRAARRRLARAVRARSEPRRAVADPRRGRRGDLPPARLPALRARARARARRLSPSTTLPAAWNERMRTLVGIERADDARRRAAGRALVGRPRRLLPDLHARHALLGAVPRGDRARARPDRRRSCARASTTACSAGCGSTCTAAERWSRPSRSRSTRRASRSATRRFMRYLRAKYGALYSL